MGLIIKSTENKSILMKDFNGQVTEIESVYARVEIALRPDGKTVECAFPYIFASKEAFKLGASVMPTDVSTSVNGEVLEQSMYSCHELCKLELEKLGYEVDIDLI